MVNKFFQSFQNKSEQTLLDGLLIESIQMFGSDVFYLPRSQQNTNSILGEDASSIFYLALPIEMYLENVDGFEGDKNWLSKLGLSIQKSSNFLVSQTRFEQVIKETPNSISPVLLDLTYVRPKEGDLIYFPLTKGLFEIKFADNEAVFYQLGKTYVWRLSAEMFRYSNEKFLTGIEEIDSIAERYANDNSVVNDSMADNVGLKAKLDAILDPDEPADPFSLKGY